MSELGQAFANDYYADDKSKFVKRFDDFGNDFCNVFNEQAEKIDKLLNDNASPTAWTMKPEIES